MFIFLQKNDSFEWFHSLNIKFNLLVDVVALVVVDVLVEVLVLVVVLDETLVDVVVFEELVPVIDDNDKYRIYWRLADNALSNL